MKGAKRRGMYRQLIQKVEKHFSPDWWWKHRESYAPDATGKRKAPPRHPIARMLDEYVTACGGDPKAAWNVRVALFRLLDKTFAKELPVSIRVHSPALEALANSSRVNEQERLELVKLLYIARKDKRWFT